MSGSRENLMNNRWQNGLPRPIAFVFSGGAALGAIQVGMLQALTAVSLQPDIVVGTSAGALNGAMVAARGLAAAVETLTTLWRSFTRQDFFPGGRLAQVRQLLATRNSLFPNNQLSEMVCRLMDVSRFDELQLPFGALATELDTFHGALFTSGELRLALLASAAIPGVFPPVEINGKMYVDGALTAYVPLRAAVAMGAASLVVLDAGEICHHRQKPRHVAEMFLETMQVAMRQRVQVEAPLIAQRRPVLYLPTPCPMSRSTLDFSESGRLMVEAEQMARRFLETAVMPTPGQMCGAPHFHDDEPMLQLVKMDSAS
jgi:NTE family protein